MRDASEVCGYQDQDDDKRLIGEAFHGGIQILHKLELRDVERGEVVDEQRRIKCKRSSVQHHLRVSFGLRQLWSASCHVHALVEHRPTFRSIFFTYTC